MKHKLLSVLCLLLAFLMLCLTACSGTTDEQGNEPNTSGSFADVSTDNVVPTVQEEPSETGAYVCPIDFEEYWEKNEDIYAWLEIPGSDISYPVFQHPSDDEYYLRRDINGNYATGGVLFTEVSQNSKDFSDPLTIIYGHNMTNKTMFGTLKDIYSSQEGLDEHSTIKIYLPEEELDYTVFACVPYDDRHILKNYDFSDPDIFTSFFYEIYSIRDMQAQFPSEANAVSLTTSDKVLVLSTCITSTNSDSRYLVFAKLV